MNRRFQNFSTFERDGLHVQIDRTAMLHVVCVRVWKDLGPGDVRWLSPEGHWEEVPAGEWVESSFKFPHDVILALQQAMNEDEVPTAATSTLLSDTLKTEQIRVDKLLDHLLKGNHEQP